MSYGQQSSSSNESRGLMGIGSRSYLTGEAIPQYDRARAASMEAQEDPGGLSFMPAVNTLMPVGRFGLHPSVDPALLQLGQEMFSGASASRANRGYNTAASLEGVAGDALRMMSGQLVPQIQAYQLARAQLSPQLRQLSMGYATTPTQIIGSLLSGTGASSSSGSGFGFDASELAKLAMSGAAAGAASDRRLKSNIIRLGTHPLGIGWYEYDIFGRREQGVMADEVIHVKPEAVSTGWHGYLLVNYDLIGRI